MSFSHLLEFNENTRLPQQMIFLDTETWEDHLSDDYSSLTLRLGVACYWQSRDNQNKHTEKWLSFKTIDEFWDWVEKQMRKHTKTYIYAHNVHFDFFVVETHDQLKKREFDIKRWFIDSNVFILHAVKYRKDEKDEEKKKVEKSLVIVDSGNIIKTKLANLGKTVGLEKQEVDFHNSSDQELLKYCRNDVEILKRFMLGYRDFVGKYDLGNYAYTIASQSLNAFRHRFLTRDLYIHKNFKALALERESYRGGRNEAFYIGRKSGKFYYLDVNSMYPFIMKNCKFPYKIVCFRARPSYNFFLNKMKEYSVLADVKFWIDEPAIAIRGNRLLFPTGKLRGVLTDPEIRYVQKYGKILKVYRMTAYKTDYIFKKYVDELYGLKKKFKQEDKRVYFLIAKLMLNSLYGKFAQINTDFKVVRTYKANYNMIVSGIDSDTGEEFYEVHLNGKVWAKAGKKKESFNSFPAISSFCSSYARLYLWELIKKAEMDNCYYCDTDSLLVNEEGYNNLKYGFEDSEKLGMLKLEKIIKEIFIYGCKDYSFDGKVKIKGVKENAKWLDRNTIKQRQYLKFRTMLRQGKQNCILVKKVTKHLRRNYEKGEITPSGRVIPYHFS